MAPFDITMYYGLIGLVSITLTLFILLTYLASKVFRVPTWEAYLSVELSELLKSFLILIFAVGFFEGANEFTNIVAKDAIAQYQIEGDEGLTPPRAASRYLQGLLESNVLPGISDTFKIQVCLSIMNMLHRRIGEFVLTVTYKVFPGVDSIVQVTNVVGYGLVAVFGSLYAQILAMEFINALMINLFLPAGIILRFIPPTRDAGVFLIAMAIGFQTVFPATYLINSLILQEIEFPDYETPFDVAAICGAKYVYFGVLGNQVSAVSGAGGMVFNTVFSEVGLNFFTPQEFANILRALAPLSLPAFFLPAFSTTITFAFINALTKFMMNKL